METYSFPVIFKHLLDSHGITPAEFSARVDIRQATISRYIAGLRTNPSVECLIKIADYFDVSVDYLLGRTEKEFDVPSPDVLQFASLYSMASDDDKLVINAVLQKYRKG